MKRERERERERERDCLCRPHTPLSSACGSPPTTLSTERGAMDGGGCWSARGVQYVVYNGDHNNKNNMD